MKICFPDINFKYWLFHNLPLEGELSGNRIQNWIYWDPNLFTKAELDPDPLKQIISDPNRYQSRFGWELQKCWILILKVHNHNSEPFFSPHFHNLIAEVRICNCVATSL
jgi:hypothetical protein